ncbi:MAG: homoserine kinase [Alphaproteobacteria bacterium]|nr:homoserine kinase [Alphaproteobacteria bacterium]
MAVYTEVSDRELISFVAEYDIGGVVACKGIAEGVENSNFLLQSEAGTYILTLYEKRVRRQDLPFFLGLMDHLARRGISCPTPLEGRDGEVLRELAGRPAAIVSFLKGVWVRRPSPKHCAQVGEAMARLHLAAADFAMERPNALSLAGWRKLYEACAGRADEVQAGLGQELADELEELEANWPSGLPWGVIHADLFPDNVFFLDDRLSGLIDFYFACNEVSAFDLAICLNAWCFEPDHDFNITKARHMLSAYRNLREFSQPELEALPLLARGAALRFLLTRLYDWLNRVDGAMVKPKDPMEYLKKLRFHRGVRGPGAYGLD